MTTTHPYAARLTCAATTAFAAAVLAGCGGADPVAGTGGTTAPAATKAAAPSPSKVKATVAKTSSAPPTTSALGAFPPVVSSGPSPVNAAAVRSAADLPAAFQCPAAPPPIVIAATGPGPAVTVCQSKLAGEALYLWFVDSPDARFLALQAALAKAKYVHGGPTWVAGGTIEPTMGQVGGDVYR